MTADVKIVARSENAGIDVPRLSVLLVSHNRRASTVRAVEALRDSTGFKLDIVLFDDASTDGTVDAVLEIWPDALIARGDGSAFWNGGLHAAWTAALGRDADAYLWLNDDVLLDSDAIERLRDEWDEQLAHGNEKFILVGATRDGLGRETYGGIKALVSPASIKLQLAGTDEKPFAVDTFNGNIVLVPASVVEDIGINEPRYFHNLGDIDYGLRASAAGIPVVQLAGTLGICEANVAKYSLGYGSPGLSVFEQWRKVNTHHGLPPRSWLLYTRRHSGRWWPVHFLLPYRHLLKFWRLGNRGSQDGSRAG